MTAWHVYALLLTAPVCPECGEACKNRAHYVGSTQGHGFGRCWCPTRHEWRRTQRVRTDDPRLGLSAVEADWLAQIAASCGVVAGGRL